MLHSGDILLAINGVGLETANLSQAAEMLKNAGERVSLKVSKENGELDTRYVCVQLYQYTLSKLSLILHNLCCERPIPVAVWKCYNMVVRSVGPNCFHSSPA